MNSIELWKICQAADRIFAQLSNKITVILDIFEIEREGWKAGHDPKKFTYGCFLSDLTGFGDIPPAPTFRTLI